VSTLDAVLDTNVVGTFLFCREAAKVMQRHGYGRIVNLSTVAVPLALAGEAAYVASKAAVEALTRVLAHELGPHGITVNAVGPTPVPTALIANVPQERLDRLVARQAIPRFGTPADVVNVVEFFLRPESGFVTGQTVYLGGVS
jgi:3-oxoacyl-[acyl-carrier protein] reductase